MPNSALASGSKGHVGSQLLHDDSTLQIPEEGHPSPTGSGAMTARQSSTTAARRRGPADTTTTMSKADFQRLQKYKENSVKHEKMLAQRDRDEEAIKERAVRSQQIREQKFKEMMDDIRSNDGIRVEAAHIVHQQEMEQYKKRQNMWAEYDREVSQRIELQLQKYMTRKDPTPRGPIMYREELMKSDDPVKRCLLDHKAEDNFRRVADNIIQGGRALSEGKESLQEMLSQRRMMEEEIANRATTRPVLPVENWGQQELFAGPYGYFAQRCERMDRGEPFHSTRRMGAGHHLPDETDGVESAGKKREKTRITTKYNQMGMLVGDHCKVGEAYRHKKPHGAGSAAPLQDHYFYERGNDVVESEFPVGKRCFNHLNQC